MILAFLITSIPPRPSLFWRRNDLPRHPKRTLSLSKAARFAQRFAQETEFAAVNPRQYPRITANSRSKPGLRRRRTDWHSGCSVGNQGRPSYEGGMRLFTVLCSILLLSAVSWGPA